MNEVFVDPAFERHRLEAIFRETPAAMALWRGHDMIFEMVNPGYQRLFAGSATARIAVSRSIA